MDNILSAILSADFFFTAIRVMTPILFASMACMVFYKGGVDAIGTEGIMLMCSLAAVLGGYITKHFVGGLFVAALVGSLLAMAYVFFTNQLKTNSILAGIALNTLAGGLTVFVLFYITGEKGSSQSLTTPVAPNIDIPLLENIPVIGEVLSGHNLVTYLGLILVVVLYFFIYKTPLGLRIRAVGENPGAANSVGLSVLQTKYITAIIAGALAGLGGAFMSMAYVSNFSRDMVAGRGFIGMAAEGMGHGKPIGVLLASLLFGLADALAIRLQMVSLPARLVQALPYIITIIVISVYSYIELQQKKKNKKG